LSYPFLGKKKEKGRGEKEERGEEGGNRHRNWQRVFASRAIDYPLFGKKKGEGKKKREKKEGRTIAAALDAKPVEVEFVVNNAGFGLFGDRGGGRGGGEKQGRKRRGRARSLAAFCPGPGIRCMMPQAYVLSFS